MTAPPPEEITACLQQIAEGDKEALNRLLPHVYADLRQLAGGIFRGQRGEHTLQPTVLVHEAYLRLVRPDNPHWENRRHFLRVAAMAMRQLLVDYARARSAEKRAGSRERLVLESDTPASGESTEVGLLALNDALHKLEQLSERQARIIELRTLGGLSAEETAEVLGVSERTVFLDLKMARAFLEAELVGSGES